MMTHENRTEFFDRNEKEKFSNERYVTHIMNQMTNKHSVDFFYMK